MCRAALVNAVNGRAIDAATGADTDAWSVDLVNPLAALNRLGTPRTHTDAA
ncbi:hypothetical protein [Thermomonospora umbrina]|uniref:hypothetical protein n=1 Tax=Thermomonospora umbrina TaxID=111806 RepID=UPI001477689E|nr:hypothetical protein [Thermomonospora umbrina]